MFYSWLIKKTIFLSKYFFSKVDKVEYIEYIKQSPSKDIRNAETALLCGNTQDAESILIQSNLIFRAVMLNLNQYNWDRYLS